MIFSNSVRQPGKAWILIVDDERRIAEDLSRYLHRAGYNVIATVDARTAMRTLVDHVFDVIITDMRMSFDQGGLDGQEVVLAAKKANPNAKVIVLTAYYETTLMADTSCDLALNKNDVAWENLPDKIDQLRWKKQDGSTQETGAPNKSIESDT